MRARRCNYSPIWANLPVLRVNRSISLSRDPQRKSTSTKLNLWLHNKISKNSRCRRAQLSDFSNRVSNLHLAMAPTSNHSPPRTLLRPFPRVRPRSSRSKRQSSGKRTPSALSLNTTSRSRTTATAWAWRAVSPRRTRTRGPRQRARRTPPSSRLPSSATRAS